MQPKEEIQQWAYDEWARLDQEKTERAQAKCTHARSGSLYPSQDSFLVRCDDCGFEDLGRYIIR